MHNKRKISFDLKMLLSLYLLTFGFLLVISSISHITGIDISKFTRDPTAIMGAHPFIGVLSNIGVLLWSACASVCFFSAGVLYYKKNNRGLSAFLFSSGLVTSILLLDDLFLLHERIFPRYFNIHEELLFSIYCVMILLYIVKFRRLILKTEFIILFLALGFFVLSLIVDQRLEQLLPWRHLFEDGFKLFGIVSWFCYFVATSFRAVKTM